MASGRIMEPVTSILESQCHVISWVGAVLWPKLDRQTWVVSRSSSLSRGGKPFTSLGLAQEKTVPGSVISTFSEPEDFGAALRADGCLGILITAGVHFRARLTQVSLNALYLSAAEEHLPRIAFFAVPTDMVLVLFPIGNAISPICGGTGAHAGEFMTLGPGTQVHARTDGASHWGTIRLPIEELGRYGVALTGMPFSVPPGVRRRRSRVAAGRRLRSLHAAAIRMATKRPQILVEADAVHGLEQQLIHAIVECLSKGSADNETRAERRNRRVMVRFEQILQDAPSLRVSLAEICTVLGISERLLRRLCAQHLGVSPTTYDRLRRMSLVRCALGRADTSMETVSAVARLNGFRDLGRFAINYRAAFGESPSRTLRKGKTFSLERAERRRAADRLS